MRSFQESSKGFGREGVWQAEKDVERGETISRILETKGTRGSQSRRRGVEFLRRPETESRQRDVSSDLGESSVFRPFQCLERINKGREVPNDRTQRTISNRTFDRKQVEKNQQNSSSYLVSGMRQNRSSFSKKSRKSI